MVGLLFGAGSTEGTSPWVCYKVSFLDRTTEGDVNKKLEPMGEANTAELDPLFAPEGGYPPSYDKRFSLADGRKPASSKILRRTPTRISWWGMLAPVITHLTEW